MEVVAYEEQVSLFFCGSCGVLLPFDEGPGPIPECPNCAADVRQPYQRCEGTFTRENADRLLETQG